MRLLFTTMPAIGHLRPLMPIMDAARRLGHEVAICLPASAADRLDGYHVALRPAGEDWVEREIAATSGVAQLPADHGEAVTAYVTTVGYPGEPARRMAADVLRIARDFGPDLIVRENAEFGGYLAAEALGIPHSSVGVTGAAAEYLDLRRLIPQLEVGRAELGLPPDPTGERVYAYLHANLVPPDYDPLELATPNVRCYRHTNPVRTGERLPNWITELLGDRPLVYAAFGSMHPRMRSWRPIAQAVLAALGELDCTAVVAVGDGNVEAYPAVPGNVRLVGAIAQPLMLEGADLFVNHGGFNGIRESLRAGVPMTVLPWMTDSVANAERARAAGVATVVPYRLVEAGAVRAACATVLTEPAFRANAQRIRRAMLALPPVESYVEDLVSLAARVPA